MTVFGVILLTVVSQSAWQVRWLWTQYRIVSRFLLPLPNYIESLQAVYPWCYVDIVVAIVAVVVVVVTSHDHDVKWQY